MESNQAPSEILLNEIQVQSQTEAEAVLQQARKEADQLLKTTRKTTDKFCEEMIHKAEAQAANIKKRILSSVHLELKKQHLNAREIMIHKVIDALWQKIYAFRESKEYPSVLRVMVAEGVSALDGNTMIIKAGSTERKLITKQMIDDIESQVKNVQLKLSDTDISEPGIIIETADGRTRFDNRFSARIKRFQDAIRLATLKDILET